MRGGRSNRGTYCGVFYVTADYAASYAYWDYGAALSLLHIILFVVVDLYMVIVVDHSLFILLILYLILPGAMVLL